MQKIDTIGSIIRHHREESKMPLRKLAYKLDIDQSTLSKIERDERKINPELLDEVSDIFNIKIEDLQVAYYSDTVAYQIRDLESFSKILEVAEKKVEYIRQSKLR
ncbi:helix-turn-helix domain-containing protein [Ancylomarina sp. 16SWW S1-10-2]|uniref:helix-turn-helix domain-containing protein n=1 Tax=Ancylomarina sp. 16SWW S1-10-2 TaxID=2499681 RepID=UPI0012AD72F6|nr:helix-turn-helix transcriptional regulator [Ancylomarina sp. 16SWW S1-10-2]MRT92917.1 XRE family transcriptional regulator [Ancylomarina sp. 16SWW S1-10-2]